MTLCSIFINKKKTKNTYSSKDIENENSNGLYGTHSKKPSVLMCNMQEFNDAVVSSGYTSPTDAQFQGFSGVIVPYSGIDSKLELAMFLAQLLWESDGLQEKVEQDCLYNGCQGEYQSPQDIPGESYYGRGYIQLTWASNYLACSQDLFKDNRLLKNPNVVAQNDKISWASAAWFWKKNVHAVAVTKKFGATTKAINGALECTGSDQDKAKKRFAIYTKVLKAFGVNEAPDETGCYD